MVKKETIEIEKLKERKAKLVLEHEKGLKSIQALERNLMAISGAIQLIDEFIGDIK